jgi:hypothetical protein
MLKLCIVEVKGISSYEFRGTGCGLTEKNKQWVVGSWQKRIMNSREAAEK